jgi:hypothetical protein
MIAPVLVVLAVVVAARTRLDAVVMGRPVSVPVIGILFTIVVLALAVAVLFLARQVLRDGLRLKPAAVTT